MEKEIKRDLNIMKVIMIVISIIPFILILSTASIPESIELQPIGNNLSPLESIPLWIFLAIISGILYYSYLCLIALILWAIFNRKNPEANKTYTIRTKSGNVFTKPKPSKYDIQIDILWSRTLVYACIIEISLLTLLGMFGIIKLIY